MTQLCVCFFVSFFRGLHDRLLSFTVFQIQVYGGPYQWTVFRRFSEFRDLLGELEDAGYAMDSLPPLPPRTFLPSTRDSVVGGGTKPNLKFAWAILPTFETPVQLFDTALTRTLLTWTGKVAPGCAEHLSASCDHALVDQPERAHARVFDARGPGGAHQPAAALTHRSRPRIVPARRRLVVISMIPDRSRVKRQVDEPGGF